MDGIMGQIRGLLAEGKSSREIISIGYSPRTVYRCQRIYRRRNRSFEDRVTIPRSDHRPSRLETGRIEAAVDPPMSSDAALHVEVERVKTQLATLKSDNEQLRAETKTSTCPGCGHLVGWGLLKTERRAKPGWYSLVSELMADWEFFRRCPRCGFEEVRPESSHS